MSEYVAILAGGSGTRLWPLSRSHRPKQLLQLVGSRSLVQATVDRVLPLVPHERIVIVTEASHADQLREQLPELPRGNILVEPVRRGTAAAIGLAVQWITHRDPSATMASLHSDHAVGDEEDFRRCLSAAFEVARSGDWLVTLGIRPSSPHTGLGYIQVGAPIGVFRGLRAHRAIRFVEKPDRVTAEEFLAQGYVWNPGYFIWRVDVIRKAFETLLPDMQTHLAAIGEALGGADAEAALVREYPQLRVESIDYGIMERADRIATIPADFGWNDIGGWGEVWEISVKGDGDNVVRGDALALQTARSLVWGSDRPIFTLGVEDLVIVDLPDALLVCSRAQAEQLKVLIERLQADPKRAKLL
ncbi:MAG: mannose-1-phosphate guanylyltransferase [Chloroflexi bacterium]|nr:mannose-1-phosphate guanylyltransferase [Chloroflexota bacterium]